MAFLIHTERGVKPSYCHPVDGSSGADINIALPEMPSLTWKPVIKHATLHSTRKQEATVVGCGYGTEGLHLCCTASQVAVWACAAVHTNAVCRCCCSWRCLVADNSFAAVAVQQLLSCYFSALLNRSSHPGKTSWSPLLICNIRLRATQQNSMAQGQGSFSTLHWYPCSLLRIWCVCVCVCTKCRAASCLLCVDDSQYCCLLSWWC